MDASLSESDMGGPRYLRAKVIPSEHPDVVDVFVYTTKNPRAARGREARFEIASKSLRNLQQRGANAGTSSSQ
jgi:hypothetical protein